VAHDGARLNLGGRRGGALTAVAAALVLPVAACSGSSGGGSGSTGGPAQLSMWTRAASSVPGKAFVDGYNASHSTKVRLTVIPDTSYQTKVATAAGSNSLPDLVSSDVIYMPNYTTKHLFVDITGKVNALPFKDNLAPSHLKLSTVDGKIYGVPHIVDGSAMIYNKDLFTKAGLNPAKPPRSYQQVVDDAKKITTLGGGVYGFFFAGNCPGCLAYTTMPSVWGSGGTVMNDKGTTSTLDTPQIKDMLGMYRQIWADKSAPQASRDETGATWGNAFESGKIGMAPLGSGFVQALDKVPGLHYGVAPMPTKDGHGPSTFVGGDVIGIAASSKHVDAAWDFIKYTLSDKAQASVLGKSGAIPVRTDLAAVAKNPATKAIASLIKTGQTPYSLRYGEVFNDPNGPWLAMFRQAIFKADVPGATTTAQQAADKALSAK
jgi:multiple sugar transport system substrate-binding protein